MTQETIENQTLPHTEEIRAVCHDQFHRKRMSTYCIHSHGSHDIRGSLLSFILCVAYYETIFSTVLCLDHPQFHTTPIFNAYVHLEMFEI